MGFKTYVAVCADVEAFRLSPEGAKEQARVLSEALCPEVAEVCDTRTHEVLAIYVDGTEYHPSLGDLARSPEAFARGYEAQKLADSVR
jgi:hypothetical protein